MSPARSASLTTALAGLALAGGLAAAPASADKVALCHAPPGQPDHRSVLHVSPSAAERHLARHDDTLFRDAELCNDVDDDCDGRVDESFPTLGRPCLVGIGACLALGQVTCDPQDPSATRCDAEPLPPPEPGRERTCTGGHDEDCDGLIDRDDPDCTFDPARELPSPIDLPIAIDCCAVSPDCALDAYGDWISQPIRPCPTSTGEVVSCLEFTPVPEQNACWSVFSDQIRPALNVTIDFLESAPVTVEAMPVFVDNGDRRPMYSRMRDRMLGEGRYAGNPAGVDRYPWAPGIDSWVVRLPIVECQTSNHCQGAFLQQLVGALCFEIREIDAFPEPALRGRFLHPERDHVLFEECELGPVFAD